MNKIVTKNENCLSDSECRFHNLKVVYYIWYRDLLHFWRNRIRLIFGFTRPLMWWFFFGAGMSASLQAGGNNEFSTGGVNYLLFLFPGILGMGALFYSIFNASSIIDDRERGFLKAILVSPIKRVYFVMGKAIGGATTSTLQNSLSFVFLPFIGYKLGIVNFIILFATLLLISFAICSLGIFISAGMENSSSFHSVVNFVVMPMFILSGALFPLTDIPSWMRVLVTINPMAYGVDIMRRIFLWDVVEGNFFWGMKIGGRMLSIWEEVGLIALFALIMHLLSVRKFRKS